MRAIAGFVPLIIICLVFGIYLNQSLISVSSPSRKTTSWQVLKTNVTVRYGTGCMVFEAVGHTCPPKGENTTTSSLTGVELIVYRGTDYYAGNFSAGPYGQTAVSYLIVWFTNTTIYCITPPNDNYPACPQNTNTVTATTASNLGYGGDLTVAYAIVNYSGCWTGT
jgi:hypothetical protein